MPKEKTVRLVKGKSQTVTLSYDEQALIYTALVHWISPTAKNIAPKTAGGSLLIQFRNMLRDNQ